MLETLRKKNPEISVYSIYDPEFRTFGEVLALDTEEIIKVGERFEMPAGVIYTPSTPEFEAFLLQKRFGMKYMELCRPRWVIATDTAAG